MVRESAPATYPSEALAIPERFGLLRELGKGAEKRVCLAYDKVLDREVAIGVIDLRRLEPRAVERIRREARLMARIGERPHLVTIFDAIESPHGIFIVSRYMRGGDLATYLGGLGAPLPLPRGFQIATQVCRALEVTHAADIAHRDVKPGNIFLDEDSNAYLGDFGLATDRAQATLTEEGTILGTPSYMAPEQAMGQEADWRSDIYSLGCVLYELFTGAPPFTGRTVQECLIRQIHSTPVSPMTRNPSLPPALDALILTLLEKRPEKRPQTVRAVRARLEELARLAAATERAVVVASEPALPSTDAPRIVGRDQETARIRQIVDRAVHGQGAVVLVAGEAGIGKTTLVGEAVRYAQSVGALVALGRTYAREGAPPFWPWVEIVRQLECHAPVKALVAAYRDRRDEVALLLAARGWRPADSEGVHALDSGAERFRLFDSVTRLLVDIAEHSPVFVALEDLDWADHSSQCLLEFLAPRISSARIVLLVTYRDTAVTPGAFADVELSVAREPSTERIRLAGLSRDAGGALVRALGGGLDDRWIDAIYERSEGNPFFIKELTRHVAGTRETSGTHAGARAAAMAGAAAMPSTVRHVIGRRLEHLDDGLHRVLTTAAVLGREFAIGLLSRVTGDAESRLTDLLGEAVQNQVIEPLPDRTQAYRFSHALIRETLLAAVGPTERARIHAAVAAALETHYGTAAPRHAAELAHHYLNALPTVSGEKAVTYAILAGEDAVVRCAYDEAAEQFERALALLEESGADPDERRCELLLATAEARYRAGAREDVLEVFRRAADLARRSGNVVALARAALGLSGTDLAFGSQADAARLILEEALDRLGPGDSVIKVRVLSRLASLPPLHRDSALPGRERGEAAIGTARRLGDRAALLHALVGQHTALAGPQDLARRIECAQEIVELATELANPEMRLEGYYASIIDLLEQGDPLGLARAMRAHEELADQVRQRLHLWRAARIRAMSALYRGDLDTAERLAGAALAAGGDIATVDPFLNYVVQIFRIRWDQDRLGELEPALQAVTTQQPTLLAGPCGLCLLHCLTGDLARGARELGVLARREFRDLSPGPDWTTAIAALVEACAVIGDAQAAATLYEILLPYEPYNVAVGATCYHGAGAYFLGLLAATMARWPAAHEHFVRALDMHQRMGAHALVARTLLHFGKLCLTRRDVDRADEGTRMIAGAADAARRLGMHGLMRTVDDLRTERTAAGGA